MTNVLSTERAIEALYTVRAYYASLTAGYPKGKDCKGIGDVMCSEIANSCLMAIKALELMDKISKRDIERFSEMDYTDGYNKGWVDCKKALEQEPITWIVGKDNCQVAVRNMPIDKMKKICATIGEEEQQPCEDCISLNKLDDIITKAIDDSENQTECQTLRWVLDVMSELPSVQPQPKRGKWIPTNDYVTTAYGSLDYYRCSCCGEDSLEEGDYCPNCGADMREV